MDQDVWIEIGSVGKPHGIKGAFHLVGITSSVTTPSRIRLGRSLQQATEYPVSACFAKGLATVICLNGVDDRNQCEALKHQKVWFRRQDLLDDDDEYLWIDLIGKAINTPEGETIGVIEAIDNFGASDIITIICDHKRLDVPFISDYFAMDFEAQSPAITMVVPIKTFDECWY